jgi:plastocyanin
MKDARRGHSDEDEERGGDLMTRRIQTGIIAGALTLVALKPAAAQVGGPVAIPAGLQQIVNYTGAVTGLGYRPPQVPLVWMVPNVVVHYQAPQPVYVWAPREQPAAPVQAKLLVLRNSKAPADARISLGSTVTWVNAGDQMQTLVVQRLAGESGRVIPASRMQIRADESLTLRFYRPGIYEYRTLAQPERLARIVVGEQEE